MNPNFSNSDALNPSNPQNEASPRVMRTFNTFSMSYGHGLTARYGDVTPFFVFEAEPKDKIPFSSFHELISDVVPSVNMSTFRMMKDYFSIPYKAILPNTWDYIYANPTQGDDVPDDAICAVPNIIGLLSDLWDVRNNTLVHNLTTDQPVQNFFTQDLKWFFLLESFFDDGSLLSLLGCKLSKYFVTSSPSINSSKAWFLFSQEFLEVYFNLFDKAFLNERLLDFRTSDNSRRLTINAVQWASNKSLFFRRILEFCRDNDDFYISTSLLKSKLDSIPEDLYNVKSKYSVSTTHEIPLNFSRVIAYQLAYFHFMSNDKVDFIYSAELFRQMMYEYAKFNSSVNGIESLFFDYNGSSILYDVFSSHFIKRAFAAFDSEFYNANPSTSPTAYGYYYLRGLLTFRKSLKYGDYFTGSRPTPLAVGDVNAPVVGNGVSAIDMTKNIMVQRFLNAVNKTGRKMSDYLKGIRGANTMPLLTDPKFLARDVVTIGSQEIENTSTNQGNIVSILRSSQSKFAFEAEVEDPCIFIGVISFDVPRYYSRTIDRQFFIKDRFDMFNPYMQNIGDQEIYEAEKNFGGLTPFAYTLRHMEFKQRYSIVSGGFVENLPGYLFISDNSIGEDRNYNNLSPEFIRSHNVELDSFFPSMTGYNLSTYYHFKFKFANECNPNRNMEYSPTIL